MLWVSQCDLTSHWCTIILFAFLLKDRQIFFHKLQKSKKFFTKFLRFFLPFGISDRRLLVFASGSVSRRITSSFVRTESAYDCRSSFFLTISDSNRLQIRSKFENFFKNSIFFSKIYEIFSWDSAKSCFKLTWANCNSVNCFSFCSKIVVESSFFSFFL